MKTGKTVALSVCILVLLGLAGAAIYFYWGQQLRGFLFYTESEQPTTISGRVTAADDGPVAGVILIELGRLYGQNYRFGGVIDENGMFSVEVDGGGDYGIHIYATGYIYLPLSMHVEAGKDNENSFSLPPNPAEKHGPDISEVVFDTQGRKTIIRLTVNDPDNDLSHQVLGVNAETQEGFIFSPPEFVFPWTKKYPNGVYTLEYDSPDGETNRENWFFVAADNRCYNSPVIKHPFNKDSFIAAHARGKKDKEGSKKETSGLSGVALGRKTYESNCAVCHYADKTGTKVGPGLKGIFQMEKMPVQGKPVNEETIRNQIVNGGKDMPPYAHIKGENLSALIAYLKTL